MDETFDRLFHELSVEENSSPYTTTSLDTTIRGTVKRIVFTNADQSYTVIRLEEQDSHAEDTLVGTLPNILEGQEIEATGRWELHKEHGRQFHVSSFRTVLPTTPKGIAKYLASGILPGIGEVYAQRIVKRFGADTIRILDKESERLKEIPGIGKKRIQEIREAWHTASAERECRVFLQGIGLSPHLCTKIITRYGVGSAAELVRRNPYRLAHEIEGIGFLSADNIAMQLGLERNSPLRLSAGILYVMEELASLGHTCCPKEYLISSAIKLLGSDEEHILSGLKTALEENKIIREVVPVPDEKDATEEIFFSRKLYGAETSLANAIRVLLNNPPRPLPLPTPTMGIVLNQEQLLAVRNAFTMGFSIVTGGPGVGKTTVIRQICEGARQNRLKVFLAAPTGRAAKRMTETTGREALTIHRLLKWDVATRSFVHNADNPLPCDMLIIDEVSMLDTPLADSLFSAIAPGTRIVLVGDKDQLPSVGPGAVLHDLIACRKIPVTFLVKVYRQKDGSRIITNAHAVNSGHLPDISPLPKGTQSDFYWIEQDDPQKAAELIVRMVSDRIPKAFGFHPVTDIQVLTPMRKGNCGTLELNSALQKTMNPPSPDKPCFQYGTRLFRVGDKVMQTSNNYEKGVFNGELGIITAINLEETNFQVQFDIGIVQYALTDADQLQLAYVTTVHKSQGSEFPAVVLPLLTQHFVMLQKNLLYTAMTRAKKLLVLVGSRRALSIAVKNNTPTQRKTRLSERI